MPYVTDPDGSEAYVVILDGIVFRCYVESVGTNGERRWIFATKDTTYNAFAWFPIIHESELIEHVREWWAQKKALGQG